MSTGIYDKEKIKNFNLGDLYGRYAAWSSVLYFLELEKAEISPKAIEIIKNEAKKWEWLWCESNKRGEPLPVSAWDQNNDNL